MVIESLSIVINVLVKIAQILGLSLLIVFLIAVVSVVLIEIFKSWRDKHESQEKKTRQDS